MLIQGKLERTETNLMHFKWEVTWTHGNQPYTFSMGQRVNSHFEKFYTEDCRANRHIVNPKGCYQR